MAGELVRSTSKYDSKIVMFSVCVCGLDVGWGVGRPFDAIRCTRMGNLRVHQEHACAGLISKRVCSLRAVLSTAISAVRGGCRRKARSRLLHVFGRLAVLEPSTVEK